MNTSLWLRNGQLIIEPRECGDGLTALLYSSARSRRLIAFFSCKQAADAHIGDNGALWFGSSCIDLTTAEVARVLERWPDLRVTGACGTDPTSRGAADASSVS